MPRARATEMPQRPSPRGGPSNLRTSSSDSGSLHHRPRTDRRSPKLSPRGSQPSSDPVNQKKLGSRIADLESQLRQAQDELKCLKTQLVSAEAAKKAAPQQQLDKKSKKQPKKAPKPVEIQVKHSTTTIEIQESDKKENKSSIDELYEETSSDVARQETDVFEVPIENVTVEPRIELDPPDHQDDLKPVMPVPENPLSDELNFLRTKLDEKNKELEILHQENENMRSQLDENSLKISSSAESEREELTLRLSKIDQELGNSKSSALRMNEKLEAAEKYKEELENEMKRLRVQTKQWRKAADAAANILAEEMEMNGRWISERCGSMDKQHYGNAFEPAGGGGRYGGSPELIEDADDGFGGGKRKGSGTIRMFAGDLWKKKGHK